LPHTDLVSSDFLKAVKRRITSAFVIGLSGRGAGVNLSKQIVTSAGKGGSGRSTGIGIGEGVPRPAQPLNIAKLKTHIVTAKHLSFCVIIECLLLFVKVL